MDDKEYLRRFSVKIKILRNLKNLSQDYVAGKLFIDKSYYSKIERGLTNPTIIYLRNLAKVLALDLAEMVNLNINLQ